MSTFGFGQRTGQIVQTAYVVQRIRPAIEWWIKDGRAGPFFLLESFTGGDQRYRGQPTTADVSIAMGFAGHMMIELIQPRDDKPSVYKEIIDQRGYGFHHVGIAFEDVEKERFIYEGRGYHVAFSAPVPRGGHGVLHGRRRERARVRRADSGHARHGRDVHAVLASLRRLERPGSDPAVRLRRGTDDSRGTTT